MREYRAHLPGRFASVPGARKAITQFAHLAGFSGEALDDIESAVGEALSNAAEHGSRGDGSSFAVRAFMEGSDLVIDVTDDGAGFVRWDATDAVRPMSNSPRGYGIFIMRELMDEVIYTEHGSALRLVKRLPVAAAQGEARQQA